MFSVINITDALKSGLPVIDVRSPGEFRQGHIPNSVNIPLFTDEERAQVGTVYKRESEEAAIQLGYKIVEPKLAQFILDSNFVAPEGKVIVHCWRGGMRSNAFAKHLSENGFREVNLINGGYKSFRNYVSEFFSGDYTLKILGGYTGSGKTYILHELSKMGHQILDLEALANHKGSAFGGIGQAEQPSTEQFENLMFEKLSAMDFSKAVWVEDESLNVGKCVIQGTFFSKMQDAPMYVIDIPKEERANHLVKEYANCDRQLLQQSLLKISKRLGGQNVKKALEFLELDDYYNVALITLYYYDKAYQNVMNTRNINNVFRIQLKDTNHKENALEIEKYLKNE